MHAQYGMELGIIHAGAASAPMLAGKMFDGTGMDKSRLARPTACDSHKQLHLHVATRSSGDAKIKTQRIRTKRSHFPAFSKYSAQSTSDDCKQLRK